MTPLEKFLQQGDKLAAKATEGPWSTNEPACYNTYPGVYLVIKDADKDTEFIVLNDDEAKRENLEFIADARQRVVKQAAIIRVMREALDAMRSYDPDPGVMQLAANTLAEADRIAEGK